LIANAFDDPTIAQRGTTMKPFARLLITGVALLGMLLAAPQTFSQDTPAGPAWWPSPWGADDERGALNRLNADTLLNAARLISEGELIELGHVYEPGIPLTGNRHYSLTLVGTPSAGPIGQNQAIWLDEMFSGEIGQIGTQFDALGHFGVRVGDDDLMYNGLRLADIAGPYGLSRLGIENVDPIFTRGVLVDVARHKGVQRLEPGYVITVEDIESTLRAQGVIIREGDAVLFHTGHGSLWMQDNDAYMAGAPGIGIEAARWLSDIGIVVAGADNSAVEAMPGSTPGHAAEVHQWLLVRHGIYLAENLKLDELAARQVYEFAFIFTPLKFRGATGSPGSPIAVY
jgi:kynurenine formamidase